jgi:hypothetical protein
MILLSFYLVGAMLAGGISYRMCDRNWEVMLALHVVCSWFYIGSVLGMLARKNLCR